MGEIIAKSDVSCVVQKLRKENKKIVFTNGCFDILHLGHVKYLKESAKLGDVLIVGINSDSSVKKLKGSSRPINNQNDRAQLLCEVNLADYAIIFDEDTPSNLLKEIKPDIYTKGADYTLETLPETPVVQSYGGKIEFIKFVEGKSTTNIINKMSEK